MRKLMLFLLIILAAIATASFAPPTPAAKIDGRLQEILQAEGTASFLVILDARADLSVAAGLPTKAEKGRAVRDALWQTAQTSQANLRAWLESRGVPYRPFYIVNAILVTGDAALARTIAARPEVNRLVANPKIKNDMPSPAPFRLADLFRTAGIEPGVSYINAPEVWAMGFTGQGIVIGGQDTGYDWTHPAVKNQYRGWNGTSANHDYNWHDSIHSNTHGTNPCGTNSPVPCDDSGHGTHTIGTAVGDDGAGNQIGVAPGAQWIGCRNMDNGVGTPATYLECFEFFLAPYPVNGTPADGDPSLAPDVTTNSWTCPPAEGCDWATLQSAVEAQRAAGIMTVVAAGNAGPSCSSIVDPPAIYDAAYTVGALNTGTDTLASFSSRGPVTVDGSNRPKPDITAPGTSTRSSYPGGGYTRLSGTSMATPHVAGTVALLWSAVPTLTNKIDATEAYLNAGAHPIASTECGSSGTLNFGFGAGRLDVQATTVNALNDFRVPPIADFQAQKEVSSGYLIQFESAIRALPPVTSTWNFGDDSAPFSAGTAQLPIQHTFPASGIYTVTLATTNRYGTDVFSQQVGVWVYYIPLILK